MINSRFQKNLGRHFSHIHLQVFFTKIQPILHKNKRNNSNTLKWYIVLSWGHFLGFLKFYCTFLLRSEVLFTFLGAEFVHSNFGPVYPVYTSMLFTKEPKAMFFCFYNPCSFVQRDFFLYWRSYLQWVRNQFRLFRFSVIPTGRNTILSLSEGLRDFDIIAKF